MSLSPLDRKKLWGKAGGICSYRFGSETCGLPVIVDGPEGSISIGEECHIVGNKPGAARYIEHFPERDSYSNRILVCRNHHKLLDDPSHEQIYTIETLHKMKLEHEEAIKKAHEDLSLVASRLPQLTLMLFKMDDPMQTPRRELVLRYPHGPSVCEHAFGIRLDNTQESAVAQRIAITLTIWWGGGEELRISPAFAVPSEGKWQGQHSELICKHPAILVFQDRDLMCFHGHPILWKGFGLRFGTPWNGQLDLFYDIRSIEPYTENNGTLKITVEEETLFRSWR